MHNQLILYNPYYQADVIEQHLKLLIQNEKVAFGKIKSKLKTTTHNFEEQLNNIYDDIDNDNFLQLFLTDYANIYVAKVIQVTSEDLSQFAPSYYKDKQLEVEKWFLISDIQEIVRDDFATIRDNILSNFTTPNFNNHTYAMYGNNYIYPLIIEMKHEINYFENTDIRYYTNMFKSKEYLQIKEIFIQYTFGRKWINKLHPNSLDNIISAELEYIQNKDDKLYDCSTIVIKYSKTIEQEVYDFVKKLISNLLSNTTTVNNVKYEIRGKSYNLTNIFSQKPNLGTYKYLLKNDIIKEAISQIFPQNYIKSFILSTLPYYINLVQDIRNESVHGTAATIHEAIELRKNILGLSKMSILIDILKMKEKLS